MSFFRNNKFFYWIYKIQKIYKNKKPNNHYSEFAEDVMVNRIFKNYNDGMYIDIGAYHPQKGSLTYSLYKKGWKGVNIDISKTSIDLFNISRPTDLNINSAISNFNGETFYYENSPINQQNSLIKDNDNQKKVKIKCNTLNDVLEKNNIIKVDYINIDTEGTELQVLNGIDFKKYKPMLLTIEDNSFNLNDPSKLKKISFMKKNNYEIINIIGVTMFFINKNKVLEINNLIKI